MFYAEIEEQVLLDACKGIKVSYQEVGRFPSVRRRSELDVGG